MEQSRCFCMAGGQGIHCREETYMKEIGGYMELDEYHLPMPHQGAVGLNCGRNCLAYLIMAKGIRKIALPYFLCHSVKDVCYSYHVQVRFYHVDGSFLPQDVSVDEDEWLYLVNYYGQVGADTIRAVSEAHRNLIVDYTQAYFAEPVEGVDSIYSCRKFFGVADGAFLYTDRELKGDLAYDESYQRMLFVLGRYERTAQEFYAYSVENNEMFSGEPVKRMSKLTRNLLHGIDYGRVERRRTKNYEYLSERLGGINQLELKEVGGAFSYPCMVSNAPDIRRNMVKKGIYIPVLWGNVLEDAREGSWDYRLANDVLSLPCDQRYGEEEMEIICSTLLEEMKKFR